MKISTYIRVQTTARFFCDMYIIKRRKLSKIIKILTSLAFGRLMQPSLQWDHTYYRGLRVWRLPFSWKEQILSYISKYTKLI